jgi:hypothetical protein
MIAISSMSAPVKASPLEGVLGVAAVVAAVVAGAEAGPSAGADVMPVVGVVQPV